MAEEEKGKKKIPVPKEQLENAVQEEVDKRIADLLRKIDERDEALKTWSRERDEQMGARSRERDEQMGAHMNDVKRSVDAQNARVAQYGHKIDDITAEIMAKVAPRPIPPKDEPPEEAPPEEDPKEEAPAEEPKEEEPEEPKEEAPPEEEPPESEPTTFIGQCSAGGQKTHFFEKGEENQKFCPEDGTRIKHYDTPKVLKTKPKVA